jgi:alpha-galactosidase
MREQHPTLMFEICNDGGRMVDFGSAAHGDYFSITDTYDPLSNRRAFFDASYVFPPAMLESYVDRWPTPRIENFRYMLRSGMMGWFSLMFDPTLGGEQMLETRVPGIIPAWTPEEHTVAHDEFALYKDQLRPLIRDADLYHVSARPDGIHWDGMEYFDSKLRRGVLFAFHGSVPEESVHHFVLQGLDPKRSYRIVFHDRGSQVVLSGQVLMHTGVDVSLPIPLSSDLVFFHEEPL